MEEEKEVTEVVFFFCKYSIFTKKLIVNNEDDENYCLIRVIFNKCCLTESVLIWFPHFRQLLLYSLQK
jgi:hypothetical protein